MKKETIEEFLARGGTVEKSTTQLNLSELLEKEGILTKEEAEKVSNGLKETISENISKEN